MSKRKYTGDQKARKAAALREHRKNNPEKWKAWRKLDRERHKDKYIKAEIRRRLKNDFGITIDDYNKLYEEQRGLCAICFQVETSKNNRGEIKKLAVDHNHKTNIVRALLCARCNQAIGLMAESPDRLRSAINYLENHNGS